MLGIRWTAPKKVNAYRTKNTASHERRWGLQTSQASYNVLKLFCSTVGLSCHRWYKPCLEQCIDTKVYEIQIVMKSEFTTDNFLTEELIRDSIAAWDKQAYKWMDNQTRIAMALPLLRPITVREDTIVSVCCPVPTFTGTWRNWPCWHSNLSFFSWMFWFWTHRYRFSWTGDDRVTYGKCKAS